MNRIAVIVAPNRALQNTGMLSVDLAFASISSAIPGNGEVVWYCHAPPSQPFRRGTEAKHLPFRIRGLIENFDDLANFDKIVYWGDFLHARHHHIESVARQLKKGGYAIGKQEALELGNRYLMLGESPSSIIKKAVLFGGNLLFNQQSDYLDKRYGNALRQLLNDARAVWMRDIFSALKVAHLQDSVDPHPYYGVDCALLLGEEEQRALPCTKWSENIPERGAIGIFIGARSTIALPTVAEIARDFSTKFGIPVEWIPWFESPTIEDVYVQATELIRRDYSHYTMGDLFASLKRYSMIITDTYHLAVNSWRTGTPAICIGSSDSAHAPLISLRDNKKHVFFSMYDALDFYVETGVIKASVTRADYINAVAYAIQSETVVDGVRKNIARHVVHARNALCRALS